MQIDELPDWRDEHIVWSTARTGSHRHTRVFITVRGTSIGRHNFLDGQYTHTKWYKPEDLHNFDDSDYVEAKWHAFLHGFSYDRELHRRLVDRAIAEAKENDAERQARRDSLPPLAPRPDGRPRTRKRLGKCNPRHLLASMLRQLDQPTTQTT